MSENLQGLFSATSQDATAGSVRSLAGTAQLTQLSTVIASKVLNELNGRIEDYRELFTKSKSDHGSMDKLISELYEVDSEDVQFIKELDEATIEGMMKSQQSKRSRAKGKTMTMDNYKSMMVGAVAENLLRLATGKVKSAGVRGASAASLDYSEEQIAAYNADNELVRKEVRNIQSKKSIMKSKAGFNWEVTEGNSDEDNERWEKLCEAEVLLKGIRDNVQPTIVDFTKDKLAELLCDVNINELKAADAKKLLEQALGLVNEI